MQNVKIAKIIHKYIWCNKGTIFAFKMNMNIYTSRILKCLNYILSYSDNSKTLLVRLLSNLTARLMWIKAVADEHFGNSGDIFIISVCFLLHKPYIYICYHLFAMQEQCIPSLRMGLCSCRCGCCGGTWVRTCYFISSLVKLLLTCQRGLS